MLKITGIKGLFQCLLIGMLGLALGACDDVSSWGGGASSSSSSFGSASSVRYTISGSVTNITGTLNLYNNNVPVATITPTGSNTANYSFSVPQGASYSLSIGVFTAPGGVKTFTIPGDPPGEVCVLAGAQTTGANLDKVTGTALNANLVVNIACTSSLKIQGRVTGLRAGKSLTLQNASGSVTVVGTPITSNTSTNPVGTVDTLFTATSGAYAITVNTQPVGQNCTVTGGSGTQQTADITNVVITCADSFYAVGGTVGGLSGTVGLRLNGGTTFPVSANGSFAFPVAQKLVTGSSFIVDVATQPSAQTCTILNATGQVVGSDVNTVAVSCVTNTYNVGGAVSGLGANKSVVLNITGTVSQSVTVSVNGVFTFPTKLPAGSYTASIATQPVGQTCSLTGGAITVAAADISPVVVTCQTLGFNVGGTVSGLSGGGSVTLLNNGANPVTINANGPATYYSSVLSGAGYSVTVGTQPAGLFCSVSNGVNTVTGSDVTNVNVSCSSTSYTISGTVTGLTAGSVTLTNNGGDAITRSGNGVFTFATQVPGGGGYNVAVLTQPSGQVCTVTGGTASNISANVAASSIIVDCANGQVSGTITGLTNNGLTISLNGSESLSPLSGATNFAFTTVLVNSTAYAVTVTASPAGLTCLPQNGTGPVAGNVTNVVIACAPTTYTVGGTVANLAAGVTVTLVNNLTDATQSSPTSANGTFTFNTPLLPGAAYAVTVSSQPNGYTCTVTNGSGSIIATNVSNVAVDCGTAVTYTIGGMMAGVPIPSPYSAAGVMILSDGTPSHNFAVINGNGTPAVGSGNFTFAAPQQWSAQLAVTTNSLIYNGANLYYVTYGGTVGCTVGTTAPTGTTVGTAQVIATTEQPAGGCTQAVSLTYVGPYTVPTGSYTHATGTTYAVTIAQQPAHATCSVTGGTNLDGSGTFTNANANVTVTCQYSESLISGVTPYYGAPTGSAVLTISGTDASGNPQTENTAAITLTGQGSLAFTSTKYYKAGTTYNVVVLTQPTYSTAATTRTCKVYNGSGTIPTGVDSVLNVNNLMMLCRTSDMANSAMYLATAGTGAGDGTFVTVTFDTAGVPTVGTALTANLTNPTTVVVNPANNAGYIVDQTANKISLFTIASKIPTISVATGAAVTANAPYGITISPTSAMSAYVTSTGDNKVWQYAIAGGATPTLTTATASTINVGTGPRGISFHPNGKWVYVVNGGSNTVGAYSSASNPPVLTAINFLGTATGTTNNLIATGNNPYNIAFEPSGNYAYVTNSTDGTVSQYKVCQLTSSTCTAGTLSANGAAVAVGTNPQQIKADEGSVYVLTSDNVVHQFTIGLNGTLTPNASLNGGLGTIATGAGGSALAVGSTLGNLYVTNATAGSISQYNFGTGTPKPLQSAGADVTLAPSVNPQAIGIFQ